MKTLKRMTALLLVFCLCLSFASAAEITEEPHEHTKETAAITEADPFEVSPDRMTWRIDKDGTLWIGGQSILKPLSSSEDQPWKDFRTQITEVRFEQSSRLLIDSIAYWFSGCTELTYVELAGFVFEIGTDAFKDCGKLEELMVYTEKGCPDVSSTAFSVSNGTDLYVYVQNSRALAAMESANWYDRAVEIIDISGHPISFLDGPCGVNNCTCTECTWYLKYDQYDETYHWEYAACTNCSAHEGLYGQRWEHSFNSNGLCTLCGYKQEAACTHGSRYNQWSGCTYYTYCNYCGQYLWSGVSHSTYTYSSWTKYSDTQHARLRTCPDCDDRSYEYQDHDITTDYTYSSPTQHSISSYCATCNSTISSSSNTDHTFTYGTWEQYDITQHRRSANCTPCSYDSYEYAIHSDTNSDGSCDACAYDLTISVIWDASINGGTVNGVSSVTTSAVAGVTATPPNYTPVKPGYTFRGWYTASYGGSLYNTVTISSSRTFYAQFDAPTYTVTFDPGEGTMETTTKTVTYGEYYGELPVPTREGYTFFAWFTAEEGGMQITKITKVEITEDHTLYAYWIKDDVFSVTVPAVLPLIVDADGQVHTGTASIVNNSTGDVTVCSVSLEALNGWTIVPFPTNMAHQKVDADFIGFSLQDMQTSTRGVSEELFMSTNWKIKEGETLDLDYDAVVSALSQPVSDLDILSVVFVLDWTREPK